MGAYRSTKNFEIFETGKNGKDISWEKFQKIRKLLNFQKANHSTENSGNSGMKVKWKGNFQEKYFEIRVYLTRLSSFSEFMQIPNFLLGAS